MGKLWTLQSNMNRGELDPLLVGRKDLTTYYNGVATGQGVLSIPQGGLKKQPGTEYLGTALGDGRTENFSFNVEQNYLFVFTNLKLQVYKDGVLITDVDGAGNPFIVTPWTLAMIADFDYIQSADTAIITHPSVITKIITRLTATTFAIASVPFTNIPQYNFDDASSPTPTSEVQKLSFVLTAIGDRYKIALNGVLTEELVFSDDDTTNQETIARGLQNLANTANSGISVVTTTPWVPFAGEYTVTFAGDSADAWDMMAITPIFTSNAGFVVNVTRSVTGVSKKEDTWSATRGWPVSCTFHESRLWFGGASQRPTTGWGSRPFDFYNFDQGKGLPDESVEFTLDTDQANAITSIFSGHTLQIFTTGQEFHISESPITPENVGTGKPQSNMGSSRVRPVMLDGATFFPQKTGKALLQFLFLNDLRAYQTKSISLLASHLINTPVKMAVSRGTEKTDANYVYIVNDDGSMTVFNTLAAEDVQGFTQWVVGADSTANGNIKSIAVVDNQVNLLTEREIDGSTVYLIERENTDLNTLSSVIDTTDDADITGLGHLEGEWVWAKADGAFMGLFLVSSGTITLSRTSTDKEAGLQFVPIIKTMPLNIALKNGPNASAKKKIARVSLQLHESNGVIVNGERIADKTIGVDQFDAPSPQTGLVRKSLLGWSLEAQLTITQDTPMPMTILNIGMEVAL
jgi:hypothetical protein